MKGSRINSKNKQIQASCLAQALIENILLTAKIRVSVSSVKTVHYNSVVNYLFYFI